jgi:hypothetical protein
MLVLDTLLHKHPDNISHLRNAKTCNHKSILLTNLLKSQAMLWRPKWNEPTTTGGEFEHCRACVLGVIAPAPVRHALSNCCRASSTKRVKSNGRTTPQCECGCDGRANIVHRRRREEVLGMPLCGKRTKSRMSTYYHRYAHHPRASRFRP